MVCSQEINIIFTLKGVNSTLRQKMTDMERNHQQRLCDLKAYKEYQLALIRKEQEIELEQLKCRFNVFKYQMTKTVFRMPNVK